MRILINILISVGLLIIAFWYFGADRIVTQIENIHLENFIIILVMNALLVPIVTKRWLLLLQMLSSLPNFVKCFQAQLISMYAGLFLPNLISGTAVKIVLMRKLGVRVRHTFLSIIFDKLAVVLPLLICIGISIPFMTDQFIAKADLNQFFKILLALFLALCGGAIAIYLLLRYLKKDAPIFKNLLVTHKIKFIAVFLWGLLIIAIGIFQYWVLFGFTASLADLFLVAPMVIFLSSLPISIGGWGIREGSGILLFSLIGIPGEMALLASIQIGLAGMIISASGAFLWSKDLIPEAKNAMEALIERQKESRNQT